MNRKDIELFGKLQTQLQGYCANVLSTLVKDYPEVGISELAKVVGIDILAELLQLTYSSYPCDRYIFIPLKYVETEDVDGFCKMYAEKIRRDGKMLRKEEFIEKVCHNHWMKFFELFDIRMTDSEEDLDRARNKMHGLIETTTYLLLIAKRKSKEPKDAEVFTEKELPSLNAAFGIFLDWAREDKFWSKREKSEKEIASQTKAELIASQEELIKHISENKYHTEDELRFAEDALVAIKKMRLP